jgi:hypothetical protein
MALASKLWVRYPEKISGNRVITSIRRVWLLFGVVILASIDDRKRIDNTPSAASARGQTRDGNARSTQRVFKIFFEQIYP